MIDQSRRGMRCSAKWFIRTVKGDLPRGAQGTVAYEMENLGRLLIFVNWDIGITVPMFLDEIEVERPEGRVCA